MKNVTILIPVYNDWESLTKLLNEINISIQKINKFEFSCLIINDASKEQQPEIKKPNNIKTIKIINMRENRGHARCIASGIRHLSKKGEFDHLILMDGDGEDRPGEIVDLIEKVEKNNDYSVVAKRIKRSEGFLFQTLYKMHKLITFIFTGKTINYGNFCCLTKKDVKILSSESSLWSSFSGSLKKHIKKFQEIDSVRGLRYFGPSKMSFLKLAIHSFAIIAVFKEIVFVRSVIILIIISYFNLFLGPYTATGQILIVCFNLLIFLASKRENQDSLLNSHLNEKDYSEITH